MFITVRQTQANRKHLFQVESDGQILFRARTPWADIRLPLRGENLRKLSFTDTDGRELFHTTYDLVENTLQALSKYKYLWGASSRLAEYRVADGEGRVQGAFYTQIDGMMTSQLTIARGETLYDCYCRALGKIYVISVFDGGRQIAQITKPLDTWNRLDVYYLHLDDGCRALLPILSFFIIYVDAQQFNRPGQLSAYTVEKSWSYSFNRNNDKYDPDWIARTFGPEEAERLETLLREQPEKDTAGGLRARKACRRLIGILAGVFGGLALLAVLLVVFLPRDAAAISPSDFAQEMSGRGYAVTEVSDRYGDVLPRSVCEAARQDCRIRLSTFASEEEAEEAFDQLAGQVMQHSGGAYSSASFSARGRESCSLTSGGTYYGLSRIGCTVVQCTAQESAKGEAKDAVKALGY